MRYVINLVTCMLKLPVFIVICLLLVTAAAQAQRYDGVNVKRIHQKYYKGKVARGSLSIMLGLKRSRGVHTQSLEHLPQVRPDFEYYSIGGQLTLKYEREQWHAQLYYLKQHFDAGDTYSAKNGLNNDCLYLNGFGAGFNYHWSKDEHWIGYSGLSGGLNYGISAHYNELDNTQERTKYRLIDYQLTILGIAYCHKRFGGFLELSYGTMGWGQIGLSYKLT